MNRPHVIVNCAMSADGKIALPNRKQIRISSDEDIKRMYQLRNDVDAVLVGIGTVLTDDPKLTVKEKYVKNPKQPLRVVLDKECRTPHNAFVVNNKAQTLIFTSTKKNVKKYKENVEVVKVLLDDEGFLDLNQVLSILYDKGVRKLLIEGGGTVIWNFLKNRLVDELYIYIGSIIIGGAKSPTVAEGFGIKNENEVIYLKLISLIQLGEGVLLHYKTIDESL
ncbi:MAG: 2,5-diamino-6-(ribosylamino)-4(3H)-pyrimidinone 5'-phosphate reductase [Candidatus Thermoplasmatota archaeon]|nr:2,5-diamino-6-(ribosylamino)-4(3H)-pyrimidinone 5'-phosphate reductase [Candidatus Thermoplasmatota archaeon]